jgi:tetratricopeptide (TPR) repeat protein
VPTAPRAAAKKAGAPARIDQARSSPRRLDAVDRTVDDFDSVGGDDEDIEDAPPSEPDVNAVEALLAKAGQFAAKNRKNEAAALYRDVLKADATNPDALAFLQNQLRQARKYGDLRDILLRAAKAANASHEARVGWLREVAALCESQIRDFDTAIQAWQQLLALEPGESQAREQLRRLLERASRWDDLATLLEQEAEQESDVEGRISLEKQLAAPRDQAKRPCCRGRSLGPHRDAHSGG